MERIINISVNGYTVTKDGNVAGVKGEDNATTLVIDFSEDWGKCAKTITFWNALGYNPVGVSLGTNLLTDIESSTSQYQTSIPGEALKHSGKMKVTIDGYTKEKRTRSVEIFLDVLESQEMESDPVQIVTPTQAEMLQEEIDGIIDTIQNAAKSANEAAGSAGAAAKSANEAAGSAGAAATSAGNAATSAGEAGTSEQNAAAARDEAAVHSSSASVYAANAKMSASQAIGSAQNAEASAQNAEMSAATAEGAAGEAREIAAGLEGKLLTKEDKPTIIDLIDKVTTVQALLKDGHLDKYVADDKTYIVKFGKTNTNEYIDDSFCCYGRLTVRKDLDTLVWSDFRVERIIQEFKFLPLDASLIYPNDEDFRPATYIRAYTMDERANYYWTEWETDVVDLLDSYSTTLPLSANQGRVLRGRVAANETDISDNKMYINENATAIAKNSEDIAKNKEAIENKADVLILTSDIGKNINVPDSIESPIVGVNIYGESTQDVTPTPDAPTDIVNIDNPTITLSDGGENTQSVTLSDITLRGIKSTDGSWDARDEIVVEDGSVKLVQNVGVYIFNGTETFNSWINNAWSYDMNKIRLTNTNFVVSHFSNAYFSSKNWGAFTAGNAANAIGFNANNAPFSTTEEFKAWLAEQYENGTPVTVYYVLKTPVETDITESTQQLLELSTYYPTTTVNCTGDCSIAYKADLTNAFNNIPSGGGSAEARYPITPQIDITVEEAVRTMTITQIDGIPLKDYNFTAMRVYVANSPQEEKTTTEFIVNIDSAGKKPYLSAGTGFICATSQAYWGGGIDLKNVFAWNMQSGLASPIYRTNIFSSADPIGLITTECFEEIGIKSVVADIPAGTHIQIWFK